MPLSDRSRPARSATGSIIRQGSQLDIQPFVIGSVRNGRNKGALSDQWEIESFEAGFRAGLEQGKSIGMQVAPDQAQQRQMEQAQRFTIMFSDLTNQAQVEFSTAEETLAEQLANLACAIAKKVLLRELELSTSQITDLVRRCLGTLQLRPIPCVLHVNPRDFGLINETLSAEIARASVTVLSDPAVSAGGCTVRHPEVDIDATVETRWEQAIESIRSTADE
jgi:flagellar assembly protein FliH